jgi:hypothetical protein
MGINRNEVENYKRRAWAYYIAAVQSTNDMLKEEYFEKARIDSNRVRELLDLFKN